MLADCRNELYIRNLDANIDEEALKAVFEPFGTITRVVIPTSEKKRKRQEWGFVTFRTPADAQNAIEGVRGQATINGRKLQVSWRETQQEKQRRLSQISSGADKIPRPSFGGQQASPQGTRASFVPIPPRRPTPSSAWEANASANLERDDQEYGHQEFFDEVKEETEYDQDFAEGVTEEAHWEQQEYEDVEVEEPLQLTPPNPTGSEEVAQETAARYASKERARRAKFKLRETFMRYIGTSELRALDHWKFDTTAWVGLDRSKIWTSTLEVYNFPKDGSHLVTRGWGLSELEAEGAAAERFFEDPGVAGLEKNLVESMTKFRKKHLEEAIKRKKPNESINDALRTMYAEQRFQGKRHAVFDENY